MPTKGLDQTGSVWRGWSQDLAGACLYLRLMVAIKQLFASRLFAWNLLANKRNLLANRGHVYLLELRGCGALWGPDTVVCRLLKGCHVLSDIWPPLCKDVWFQFDPAACIVC